jgi:Skp family chaperone for outer membrane proteins
MNWTKYGWVFVLIALGALWLRVVGEAEQKSAFGAPIEGEKALQHQPTAVATLDIERVWDKYTEYMDKAAEVKNVQAAFDEEYKREIKAIDEVYDEHKMQEDGSEAKATLKLKYTQMAFALKTRVELKNAEINRLEAELWHDYYLNISRAVEFVAKQQKIDLVVTKRSTEMNRSDQQSVLKVTNRQVIFGSPGVDISDAVIAHLNKK